MNPLKAIKAMLRESEKLFRVTRIQLEAVSVKLNSRFKDSFLVVVCEKSSELDKT